MAALKTQGTQLFYVSAPTVVTEVAQITGLPNFAGGTNTEIDTTHLMSGAFEFIPGLANNEPITFPIIFDPAIHDVLFALKLAGTTVPWMVALSDGTAAPTATAGAFSALSTRSNFRVSGYLSNFTVGAEINDKVTGNVTLRPTGPYAFAKKA